MNGPRARMACLGVGMTLWLMGCGQQTAAPPAGGARPGAPVSVTTTTAQRRELSTVVEATATVAPRRSVDVRSQMSGILREVLVREGQSVGAGQPLFRLDDRNETAQVERARAQLARDEAALADAQRQLTRSQDLVRQNFISQGAVDTASTMVQSLTAAVAASRAALRAAEVALSMTTISAPQPGRLGAVPVHPGAYVAAGTTPLATISELQPVLVTFAVPQRHLGEALALLKAATPAVEVSPADGAGGRPILAPLVFVDSAIDPATGTVRLKAEVDNRDGRWWPGAYVQVRLKLQTLQDAVVVPVAAVVQGARGRTVFIVDAEGLAQAKPVELVAMSEGLAAIKGLEAGAKVVLEGRQNLRSGTKVVERGSGAGSGAGTGAGSGAGSGSGGSPGASAGGTAS